MKNTIQKIPFLRPAISLAIGIVLGTAINLSFILILLISIALFSVSILLNQRYNYHFEKWFGLFIQILFVFIGIFLVKLHNVKPTFFENGTYIGTVIEKPQEKQNSFKSLINITSVNRNDFLYQTNEDILVYFKKEELAQSLNPGNQIIFSTSPQFIKNYGNPFEFDYKKYLSNKKIYRQVYLASTNWKLTNSHSPFSLTIYAEQIREKLLSIYRNQNIGKNELEILSALTLGYKRELDPETKRIFSASGAMHVLAVSGLHVGIVFWVITLLLGFLRKQKLGRIIFVLAAIVILWSYAFITGLSPSVTRASTMFTIFVIGDNLNRKASTYNSLAASALCLLVFNPNNLFEVGFQLSYSAVFGIVFLQPHLSKLIPVRNKILKFFWSLLTVSIAAQIATFPLTAFYFNQFPSYFWITNLIIIPAVMILIPLGLLLLLFSKITLLSSAISFLLNQIIKLCFVMLSTIEQLPFSIQEISIHNVEFLFLIGILISFYLLVQNLNARHLKTILFFTLAFLTSSLIINVSQLKSHEIIVYNSSENTTLHIISGRKNYVISNLLIEQDKNILNLINQTKLKQNLHPPIYLTRKDTLINNNIFARNGVVFFDGKSILFNKDIPKLLTVAPDFIINPKQISKAENSILKNTFIVINRKYLLKENSLYTNIYQTAKEGAFIKKW